MKAKSVIFLLVLMAALTVINSCGRLDAQQVYVNNPNRVSNNQSEWLEIKSVSIDEDNRLTILRINTQKSGYWKTTFQNDDYICDSSHPEQQYNLIAVRGFEDEVIFGKKYKFTFDKNHTIILVFEKIPISTKSIDLYVGNNPEEEQNQVIPTDKDLNIMGIQLQ